MIAKYLDLSTAYITQADMELLADKGHYCLCSYPEGAVVYLPAYPDWQVEARKYGYSERFCDVVDYARRHGCTLVRLDVGGADDVAELKFQPW